MRSGPLDADKIVNIPRAGVRDVADTLEREGVIDTAIAVHRDGADAEDRAANCAPANISSRSKQVCRKSSAQSSTARSSSTRSPFRKGLHPNMIVQRLLETDVLAGNIREIPREGSLLPETYRVTRGTTREQMIQRMQQAQRRVLQEAWDRRASDLPLRSPEELLTLASIVEKETGKPDERARVAAVFINRLKQRIKLQSDPTIIYGLVGGKGTLGRPITRSEITQPTPYNTYTIDGLPPGPIANPGQGFNRGDGKSGAHTRTVLCGRRRWRARILGQSRAA